MGIYHPLGPLRAGAGSWVPVPTPAAAAPASPCQKPNSRRPWGGETSPTPDDTSHSSSTRRIPQPSLSESRKFSLNRHPPPRLANTRPQPPARPRLALASWGARRQRAPPRLGRLSSLRKALICTLARRRPAASLPPGPRGSRAESASRLPAPAPSQPPRLGPPSPGRSPPRAPVHPARGRGRRPTPSLRPPPPLCPPPCGSERC